MIQCIVLATVVGRVQASFIKGPALFHLIIRSSLLNIFLFEYIRFYIVYSCMLLQKNHTRLGN